MYNRTIEYKEEGSGKLKERCATLLKITAGKLRTHFLAGVVAIIPISVTLGILVWVFVTVDNFLAPLVKPVFGRPVPGVGFGITVLLIYLIGVLVSNVLGKKLFEYVESWLTRIPLVWQLYMGTREIVNSFRRSDKEAFMQVVLVEFPRKGTSAIGFVTYEAVDERGGKLLNIFVPTSPNPMSGFLLIAKEEEVVRTDISVDAALKIVVSAGKLSSKEFEDKLHLPD
ncbi:DUF502 domain-containing protein [Chloroflexota bacterium]